jgi:hypothetical protein
MEEAGVTYFIESIVKLPWVTAYGGLQLLNRLRSALRGRNDARSVVTITISQTGADLAQEYGFELIWSKSREGFSDQCWLKTLK